jgi:hypothetical protein
MLKKNNKGLFFFMLLPLYLNLIILLIGIQVGAIVWRLWTLDIVIGLIGAWLISYKRNIFINSIGFILFLLKGGYWFSRYFLTSMRTSHLWLYEVYIGSFILILGAIGFIYSLVKNQQIKRNYH